MRAGSLRHRIVIEVATATRDATGEPIETWSTFAEVYASRVDLAGREGFLAQQVKATVSTKFRVRPVDGLKAKMRIRSDGEVYDIESIQDPDGRGRELIILTSRRG